MRIIGEDVLFEEMRLAHGFWYLATPYTKHPQGPHYAFFEACQVAALLMDAAVPVFCPIAHTHPVQEFGPLKRDHAFWINTDRPFIHAASGLIVAMLPGWDTSLGVSIEREAFARNHRQELFLPWPYNGGK